MDNLQNQTIPKAIKWITAAQSATSILPETKIAQRVSNAYLPHYKMTIKWHQGNQNTPCGVYSHMMSTVQCNSMDPAARGHDAALWCLSRCWRCGSCPVQAASCPLKEKAEAFPIPEVALLKRFSWKRYRGEPEQVRLWIHPNYMSHLGQCSWKCNQGLTGQFC